jgi:hypothetical protein
LNASHYYARSSRFSITRATRDLSDKRCAPALVVDEDPRRLLDALIG